MKVTLPGHGTFELIGSINEGALAPIEHVDKEGYPKDWATAFFLNGPAYAHLYSDGIICRFNEQIGTRKDLIVENRSRTSARIN